ncbi:hypothetical protein DFH09DRAFT_432317 [Mycena vulgaris]|nr:hypothetical protein DFH09DRAFT_432317 [Mycena vulgaris]
MLSLAMRTRLIPSSLPFLLLVPFRSLCPSTSFRDNSRSYSLRQGHRLLRHTTSYPGPWVSLGFSAVMPFWVSSSSQRPFVHAMGSKPRTSVAAMPRDSEDLVQCPLDVDGALIAGDRRHRMSIFVVADAGWSRVELYGCGEREPPVTCLYWNNPRLG